MAFIPLTTNEIATGNPVANTTQTKIKDNFEDHEARLIAVESGGVVSYPPIVLRVNHYYDQFGAETGLLKTVTNFAITITGVRLYIDQAGTAGTTTIDIKVKSGAGAFTSILTTLPSVAFGAGNDTVSVNGVLDATKVNLSAGDIIRLDTTSVQTLGKGFTVRIDYNKT